MLTAAQLNQQIRDNMNESPVASASLTGQYWCATGTTAGALRRVDQDSITSSNNYTSTSYGDTTAAGPTVSATTGARALVGLAAAINNSVSGQDTFMSFEVSGATSVSPSDTRAISVTSTSVARIGATFFLTSLTAGSNTFQCKYKVSGNTGTYAGRSIYVVPF